jgi:DNA topoisomerase-1
VAGKHLVIVESPAKAKTIQGYLGPDYTVTASVGHIRDLPVRASDIPAEFKGLPWARLGVNTESEYEAIYVVDADKKSRIADIKRALKDADDLFLATDEDREGEAISWHLLEVLKPKVPVKRMVFHEITKDAIHAALANPRDVDMDLVEAQETRRIVDRLFGYQVSEVLWRKVAQGTSAGRVQSVAVRLVVDRERERIAFTSASYADIVAVLLPGGFKATLVAVDGQRIASGKDFDSDGQLTAKNVAHLDEATAVALADALHGSKFAVTAVDEKQSTRRPPVPFTTSSLQQDAGRKLGFNSKRTMQVAQSLYERGFITYMRTDSPALSDQATNAARRQAAAMFGANHVSEQPRVFTSKSKNAQEAHEAVRPAGEDFRTPQSVAHELNHDEQRLYDLIWKRTVASQMADARVATTTVTIDAPASTGAVTTFRASGTVVLFAGFMAAYEVGKEVADDDDAEARLPKMTQGDVLTAESIDAAGHTTKPPARYTEPTLIAAMEERGIGRPSTYASIIGTIQNRDYVWKKGNALVPTWLAMSVVRLLETHFAQLVDYEFTARMEDELDLIAGGEYTRLEALNDFYRGGKGMLGLVSLLENWGEIDAREMSVFPVRGSEAVLRVGKFGPFLERGEERANVPSDLAPDEMTAEKADELFAQPSGERTLGVDPISGNTVYARVGRFGPYVSELLPEGTPKTGKNAVKARISSLVKTMEFEAVDLDAALQLLSLPRLVGADEGVDILAQNGKFGPYLTKGTDTRSLPSEQAIFECTLEDALALFAQPKERRGRGVAAPPLAEFGLDPVSEKPVVMKDGRFGPYVTDGETNASLRRGDDPQHITAERAFELIAERRAAGPSTRAAKKTSAKKAPAKKAPAKKAAAKKTAAKKAAAKPAAKKAAKKAPAKPTS